MMHCFDGIRALNVGFLKMFFRDPNTCFVLLTLVVAVMFRDLLLWAFMGNSYLEDTD